MLHTEAPLATENGMFAIQPICLDSAQKELGSVGVWARVCHRENTRACVFQVEILVSELVSVNRFSPSSVSCSEISTLTHETADYSMKSRALVMQRLSTATIALLAGAERSEVLGSARHDVGKQLKGDSASRLAVEGDVKVNHWVVSAGGFSEAHA